MFPTLHFTGLSLSDEEPDISASVVLLFLQIVGRGITCHGTLLPLHSYYILCHHIHVLMQTRVFNQGMKLEFPQL